MKTITKRATIYLGSQIHRALLLKEIEAIQKKDRLRIMEEKNPFRI